MRIVLPGATDRTSLEVSNFRADAICGAAGPKVAIEANYSEIVHPVEGGRYLVRSFRVEDCAAWLR